MALLIKRHISLLRALIIFLSYMSWMTVFRLFVLTIVTYFVMSSAGRTAKFEEVSEAFGANELAIMGIGAFAYLILIPLCNPITTTPFSEILTHTRFKKKFLPGFGQGLILASAVIIAFLFSGTYRYLGVLAQAEELPLILSNTLFRSICLFVLVLTEEFLLRHKVLNHLYAWRRSFTGLSQRAARTFDLSMVLIVALAYCLIKIVQFDIGAMHCITLFLISLSVSLRTQIENDYSVGAGFWTAILILFHPLLGLPVFGNEFSGIILVKYQPSLSGIETDTLSSSLRFLTGGVGGPLSAFALQFFLLLDITRGVMQHKKSLLITTTAR